MRTRAYLTAAIAATLLSACGATGDPADPVVASERTSPSGDPAPTVPASPSTPVEPTPTGKTDPSGPYDLVPEALRVEERAGGDRVVITFRGRGTAGWTARYVKKAVLDGAGQVVDLDADSVLSIAVFGTPTKPSDRIRRVPTALGGSVTDAYVGAAWEGVTQVFLGLEGERTPYRISTLSSPSRLVVDFEGPSDRQ